MEYTELKSEAPWKTQKSTSPDWPDKGLVTFNHVNFSYGDGSPLVLRDINATFQPHEKVRGVGLHKATACLSTCTMYHNESVCLSCVRLVLWVGPVLGKALWSQRCSAWQSLRGRSTSTVF